GADRHRRARSSYGARAEEKACSLRVSHQNAPVSLNGLGNGGAALPSGAGVNPVVRLPRNALTTLRSTVGSGTGAGMGAGGPIPAPIPGSALMPTPLLIGTGSNGLGIVCTCGCTSNVPPSANR